MSETVWNDLLEAHQAAAVPASTAAEPPHQPKAAILACSDARVPPSVIFDQPPGSLFVVRIAGNTANDAGLASLDYAVSKLGVELVIVLGHTGCGAVQAAAAGTCEGLLEPVVRPICEIAREHPTADLDQLIELNVLSTMKSLREHPGPVGTAARANALDLRGAIYDLRSGRLRTLSTDLVSTPTTTSSQGVHTP